MRPSPPIHHRTDTAIAASARTATPPLAPIARIRPSSPRQSTRATCRTGFRLPTRTYVLTQNERPRRLAQTFPHRTPGQIPIEPAAPPAPHFPRFRALALFGRRPHQRVDGLVIAGIRKPAQLGTHAPQHDRHKRKDRLARRAPFFRYAGAVSATISSGSTSTEPPAAARVCSL
jgi:hypothetical protein